MDNKDISPSRVVYRNPIEYTYVPTSHPYFPTIVEELRAF